MPLWKWRSSVVVPADADTGMSVIGARMSDARRESASLEEAVLSPTSLVFDGELEKAYRTARVPVQMITHRWTAAFAFVFLAYFYYYASQSVSTLSPNVVDGYKRASPIYLGGSVYYVVVFCAGFTLPYQRLVEAGSHYTIILLIGIPIAFLAITGRWMAADGSYSGGLMIVIIGSVLTMEKFKPIACMCMLFLAAQVVQCLAGSDNTASQNVMVILPVGIVGLFSITACYVIDLGTRRLWIIQQTVLSSSDALRKEKEDAVRLLEAQLPLPVIEQLPHQR
eukprot:Opistho-2@63143